MTEALSIECLVVGPLAANCYVVTCTETKESMVIDPGDEGDKIVAFLAANDYVVRYIVDTHGHFDHTGANSTVKEKTQGQLLIHRDDAPLLETQERHAASWGVVVQPSPVPDKLLTHGEIVSFGALTFDVAHTPGHSPGGICLIGHEVAFVGDTLFAGSIGRTDLPGGNHHTLLDSITTRLLCLADDVKIFTGHGESTTIGFERSNNPFLNTSFL